MSYITSLQLNQFRCYEQAKLEALRTGPVVLTGPNGAGKTNILEAVSLLTPGRGLRGARLVEMQRVASLSEQSSWAISAEVNTPYGAIKIGTGRDPQVVKIEKRIVRINGETAKAQADLAEYLSCVWLTPQMDRLFLDTASARRKFLDRLVFAFDPGHAGRVTRYENAMAQRSRILREQEYPDPLWLEGLEKQMAETGIAIAAARLEFTGRLQQACDHATPEENSLFPRSHMRIKGTVEELLVRSSALEAEAMLAYQLKESRTLDAEQGGAATGPHKSDFAVTYAAKGMPADQCSTGEQKALLTGIVLAHSRLIAMERGAPPILLLDEIAAHLDAGRRAALYELLLALGGQVWMTGTDAHLFDALAGKAQYFNVESSRIERSSLTRAA